MERCKVSLLSIFIYISELNLIVYVKSSITCDYCLSCSNFNEIFDVEWFISFLSKDVEIVKQLPMKGGKVLTPHTMRVPRKCTPKCYQSRLLPVLNKKHVSHIIAAFQINLSQQYSLTNFERDRAL